MLCCYERWNETRQIKFNIGKLSNFRSSRPVFCKKSVLKNFVKFTGKQQYQSLFLDKVAGLRPETLETQSLRDSGTGVFLWTSQKNLKHLFLQNTSGGCFPIWNIPCYEWSVLKIPYLTFSWVFFIAISFLKNFPYIIQ